MHSAWTSGARPFVADALTLKQCSREYQNTPFSFKKLKNFQERGHSPYPKLHLQRQGIPLPHSVIFVNENENENGKKRENNEFINEN